MLIHWKVGSKMKKLKIEEKIINFITKHVDVLFAVCITILALLLRYCLFNHQSGDYNRYLANWFIALKENGGFAALSEAIGNYNVPYMTIMAALTYIPIDSLFTIKAFSVIFDIALAIVGSKIVGLLVKGNKRKLMMIITYVTLLLLPTILLDSSLWAQCDTIYTTFILLAIYYLLKKKTTLSFVFLGIAFAFKFQALFILPLYIFMYFTKGKFSLLNFLIIPVVNFILCLPAVIAGRDILEVLLIYVGQSGYYELMTIKAPSLYYLIPGDYKTLAKFAIVLTVIAFGCLLYYAIKKKVKWNAEQILVGSLLSVLLAVFLLPGMHERYTILADVISVVWFMAYRKKIYIPILINLISLLFYVPYLFGAVVVEFSILSLALLFVIIILIKHFMEITTKISKNEKESEA